MNDVYWVVHVRLPGDDHGTEAYTRRFEFRGEGASTQAETCRDAAASAGLEARISTAKSYRGVPTSA